MSKSIAFVVSGLFVAGNLFAQSEPQQSPAPVGESQLSARNPPPLDPKNMDMSVKPQDDFYLYANGGWMKRNPVPPELSRWGSFDELTDKNNNAIREISEKAAASQGSGQANNGKAAPTDLQKVGDFYASGMDEKAIDVAGVKPLEGEFKMIDAIKDRSDVLKEIGHLQSIGIPALFSFESGQDDKNSAMVIAQASQGGLGMPDRDYYTREDEASKKLRGQYVEHVAKMFALLGEQPSQASEHANKVVALETSLAKASRTRVEMRDSEKNYNKMKASELQALTPDWNWSAFVKVLHLTEVADFNVGQPDFFKAVNQVFVGVPVDDWKAYLRWQLIHSLAASLPADFVNEDFAFFGKAMTGAEQLKPRWKRVLATTYPIIGQLVGKLFVAEYFPPEAKARALEMVNNLRDALADRIKALEWMDEPTKQEALKKLAAFSVKIGYPDEWRDYSALKIDRGPFVANVIRGNAFETAWNLQKIGKPVNRREWRMSPQRVNAYNNSTMNEIVFPAGILQPPFFNPKADDAVNYGGIGSVIGHEMTHGFDDEGRKYDAAGNLRDWWTPAAIQAFMERSKAVVAQYASYEPLPGSHINGQLTQGENIADIGGLKIAYSALEKMLSEKGRLEKIDGFTPEQRFFLGYAQIRRENQRERDLKMRLNMDSHAPSRFRTIGPLSNLTEFQKAFELPDNCPMVRPPDQRVNIW